jgi:hypothetical protein
VSARPIIEQPVSRGRVPGEADSAPAPEPYPLPEVEPDCSPPRPIRRRGARPRSRRTREAQSEPLAGSAPNRPKQAKQAGRAGALARQAVREAQQVDELLHLIDEELGCGKDAALTKALHLYLRLSRLARARDTDAATLLADALKAQERLPALERRVAETERRERIARRVAQVRRRLPVERVRRAEHDDPDGYEAGAEAAAHPTPPQPYGHPYPPPPAPPWAAPGAPSIDAWRAERRALELEMDRMRRDVTEMRLESIRRVAEQALTPPAWAGSWVQQMQLSAALAAEGEAGAVPAAALSPVEIFRRARLLAGGAGSGGAGGNGARPVAARVVAAAGPQVEAGSQPAQAAAQPSAPPPATPSAHDALAAAASKAAAPEPAPVAGDGEVSVEPLASSRLPRGAATESGGPVADVVVTRSPVKPEPEPRGRAEYGDRRVKLPKITF